MKEKCLILINEFSGRCKDVDEIKLRLRFEDDYDVDVLRISDNLKRWSAEGYKLLVVCGGDGTLNRAMNNNLPPYTDVIYFSCGTFNECAKTKQQYNLSGDLTPLKEYATANGRFFGYVTAAGSFTPLGYTVKSKVKQKIGVIAYLINVIKEYKVYDICAEITADGERYDGNYTLIMFIDSMRCFGFKFNKLYRPDDGITHMLLIKSPGKNGIINKVKIFFPMFRAFFIGFNKETYGKYITFKNVKNAELNLADPEIFNLDGEAVVFRNKVEINVIKAQHNVYIGNLNI